MTEKDTVIRLKDDTGNEYILYPATKAENIIGTFDKSKVGLENVPNVTTNDQTPTFTQASTLANISSGEKLSVLFGKIMKTISDFITHNNSKSNPHSVTKSQVGLGNVDNTSDANKPISTATQTALNGKASVSHRSTATTYGKGDGSYYGHVKLSDSTSSTSSTGSGIAATPAAVKAAYDKANIKKDPAEASGDIIDSYLTIGTRNYEYNDGYLPAIQKSFVVGTNNYCCYDSIAVGNGNICDSDSSIVVGEGNMAMQSYEAIFGRYCNYKGNFIYGIGSSDSNRANGLYVDNLGRGYFAYSVSGTGADYCEQWEWQDGNPDNEDRIGKFVAFQGTKIRLANENDDLRKVGVISGNPAVVGDDHEDCWRGKYLRDIYERPIPEIIHHEAKYDKSGNLMAKAFDESRYKINPDFDPTQEYIPREKRKEFSKIGTHGKLIVHDDGTCQVDGFCRPTTGGIATASEDGFYVMERINDTLIRVYLR